MNTRLQLMHWKLKLVPTSVRRERNAAAIRRLVGILLLILSCCTSSHAGLPKGFSNEFFWMPENQRNAEFEKYDFDTQYKIYIYGTQQIEPPMIGLAWPLARQGARIVQPLEAKLESADDDLTIRDIAFVFRVMSDLGTYDVAGDKPLMEKLRMKVSAMKNPSWRLVTEDSLRAIREKTHKD
jgi:hypothetical protein